MIYDLIVVGAGPGGLSCAKVAAENGLSTLVLEKNQTIGKKVCAGGITWNGLISALDIDISEKKFQVQHIHTPWQKVEISSPHPIIATVNRERLGQYMFQQTALAGATIATGCRVVALQDDQIHYVNCESGRKTIVAFRNIVGADGSSSLVRRALKLEQTKVGIGIHYQLPIAASTMQWHCNADLFKSGYAWVFPHKHTVSVGAYVDSRVMTARQLKESLHRWGAANGFALHTGRSRAEYINFDYRGYRFGNRYLIGDAAGLASGLTGEGIYPAIVSGQEIAKEISGIHNCSPRMKSLLKNHARHSTMVSLAGKSKAISRILSELSVYSLKKSWLDFSSVEMAP